MIRACEHQVLSIGKGTEFSGRHNDGMCGTIAVEFCFTCNRYLCRDHSIGHESYLTVRLHSDTGEVIS